MRSVLTMAVVLLFAASPAGAQIRLGVLTDLSAVAAYQGKQTQLGAVLAAEELRATGAGIELVIEDHQLQTKAAVSAMQKLLTLDRVTAVYSEFTPTSIAAAPLARSSKVLFVYSGGGTSILKENPDAFKTHMDFDTACRLLAAALLDQGARRLGMLVPGIESAERCYEGAKQTVPSLHTVRFDPGREVSSEVLGLRAKGVQAIINVGYEADQVLMLSSLSKLQYFPLLGSLETNFSKETVARWREPLLRLTAVSFPPVSRDLIERIRAKDPSNTLAAISSAALAYIHVKQLYAAAAACSDLPCRVKTLAQSAPDPAMQFTGWREHIAQFDLQIKPLIAQ